MRVIITGASRGIGAAAARMFAAKHPEAKIGLIARSLKKPAHEGLEGTLTSVAHDVQALGGIPLAMETDMRDSESVTRSIKTIVDAFGGLDVLVNNASALDLTHRPKAKQIKLVTDVNLLGTMQVSLSCLPALREAKGSVVTVSPPIDLRNRRWISDHPHYTISKYGMTLMSLGLAEDVRSNTLWPRHTVATHATLRLESEVPGAYSKGRTAEEFAECIYDLAVSGLSGETLLDDEVRQLGSTEAPLDLFVERTGSSSTRDNP